MQSLRQQLRTAQQTATACGHAQPMRTSGFRRASSRSSGVEAGGSTLVAPCSGPLPFSSVSAGHRSLRAGRGVAKIVCQAAREPMTIAITGVCFGLVWPGVGLRPFCSSCGHVRGTWQAHFYHCMLFSAAGHVPLAGPSALCSRNVANMGWPCAHLLAPFQRG